MTSRHGARLALLGMVMLLGCHRSRTAAITSHDRARLYASVLEDLHPDTAARWVVIDTLLPTVDLEADQHGKVISGLHISRADLAGFLAVQRAPVDHFESAMLPGVRFMPLHAAQLDSMRRSVRDDIVSGAAERGVNNDLFWRRWTGAFPGAGGYVILSPAMITRDGREAMVHVRTVCGPVCGDTELRHLTRAADGVWRTTGRVRLTES